MPLLTEEQPAQPLVADRKPRSARLAEITLAPAGMIRRLLNVLHAWTAAGLTLLPVALVLFGGAGGLGWGIYHLGSRPIAAALAVVAAMACFTLTAYVLLSFPRLLASRYLQWVARRTARRRADTLIEPGDCTSELVGFVPRSRWGLWLLEPAADTGLARIDDQRRELLLEGALRRYRIPFEAILGCQVEEHTLPGDPWGVSRDYIVLLDVATNSGPREVPLECRQVEFQARRAPQRRDQAQAFCRRLLQALDRARE